MNCNKTLKRLFVYLVCGVLCLNSMAASAANSKKQATTELVVVAQPLEGGRVFGAGKYAPSTVVEVHALPAEGYRFSRWSGSVVNPSAPVTKTYIGTTAQQVMAIFESKRYLIDAKPAPANAGTIDGSGYQPMGVLAPIYAQAAPGYIFDRWEGAVADKKSASTILSHPLASDMVLTAHFKPQDETFTITVTADPAVGGNVSGGGKYKLGDVATIKAEPEVNFLFNGWSGRVASAGRAETTIYVTGDATVTAKFMLNRSLVRGKASPENAGKVEGTFGSMPVGTPISIRAVPMPGFAFVHWDGPVADRTKPQTTITPTAGKSSVVTAVFEQTR